MMRLPTKVALEGEKHFMVCLLLPFRGEFFVGSRCARRGVELNRNHLTNLTLSIMKVNAPLPPLILEGELICSGARG